MRRVLDGLAGLAGLRRGTPAPALLDDRCWALVSTGRATATEAERAALGPSVDLLPLFGGGCAARMA